MLQVCLQKHTCHWLPICFVLLQNFPNAISTSFVLLQNFPNAIGTPFVCCRTSQTPSTLQASLTASCGLATHTRIFASGDSRLSPGRTEHRGCSWDLGWSSFLWLPSHSTHNTTMSTLDTGCERLAMAKNEWHGVGDWLDNL